MVEKIKQIPNTGTQKQQRDLLMIIITVGWVLSVVAVKMDWLSLEEVKVLGVTFDRWWVAAGLFAGIYAFGESQRKKADAMLNK